MKKLKQDQHSLSQNVKYGDLLKFLELKIKLSLLTVILEYHEELIFLTESVVNYTQM